MPAWRLNKLFWAHGLVILIVSIIWLNPGIKNLDRSIAGLFNNSLSWSNQWLQLWGYLNHARETWINLIIMAGINLLAIHYLPTPAKPNNTVENNKIRALSMVIYFWLFFQLGIYLSHLFFSDILHYRRLSPSLIITPWLKLSTILNNPNIKDYSYNCFPAGHTFVLVYWAVFTSQYATKFFRYLCYNVALVLCLPRLFSGAHWPSDVICTALFSILWFIWATATPLYNLSVNKLEALLAKYAP